MNIRLGFARIARATAVVYAIISMLIIGGMTKGAWEERSQALNASIWETTASDGRTFSVRAKDGWEAQYITDDYVERNPRSDRPNKTYSDSSGIFEAAPTYSGPRLRLHVPKYDDASPSFQPVFDAGLKATFWCGLVYFVFWGLFRGIRWIALGFLEKSQTTTP